MVNFIFNLTYLSLNFHSLPLQPTYFDSNEVSTIGLDRLDTLRNLIKYSYKKINVGTYIYI